MPFQLLHQKVPHLFPFLAAEAQPQEPYPHVVFLVFLDGLFGADAFLLLCLLHHRRRKVRECFYHVRVIRRGKGEGNLPVLKADAPAPFRVALECL